MNNVNLYQAMELVLKLQKMKGMYDWTGAHLFRNKEGDIILLGEDHSQFIWINLSLDDDGKRIESGIDARPFPHLIIDGSNLEKCVTRLKVFAKEYKRNAHIIQARPQIIQSGLEGYKWEVSFWEDLWTPANEFEEPDKIADMYNRYAMGEYDSNCPALASSRGLCSIMTMPLSLAMTWFARAFPDSAAELAMFSFVVKKNGCVTETRPRNIRITDKEKRAGYIQMANIDSVNYEEDEDD